MNHEPLKNKIQKTGNTWSMIHDSCFVSAGFTVLELLITVAIIGVLASIILASVSTSRARASDKKILEDLNTVRNEAQLYLDSAGSFGPNTANAKCSAGGVSATLFADMTNPSTGSTNPHIAKINSAIASANAESGGSVNVNGKYSNTRCVNSPTTWAIAVRLKEDTTSSWCVDSNNVSKKVSGDASAAFTFPVAAGFGSLCQ